jgi:hypothetical protein
MSRARALFAFNVALGLVGLLAVASLFVRSLAGISLGAPGPEALARACMSIVPRLDAWSVVTLVAALLGVAVAIRGVRSAASQAFVQRRAIRQLGRLRQMRFGSARVFVFEAAQPAAFCGGLLRPRIFLSTATVNDLSAKQLTAVVTHEAHHRRRRDPLRLYLSRVIADALFFLPALRRSHERFASAAEIAADEAAVSRIGGPAPLASALLAFGERKGAAGTVAIAPERVDHLTGRPVRRAASVQHAWAVVVSALALAMLAGAAVVPHSTPLNLPLMAAQWCMAAMVGIPLAAGLVAVRWLTPRMRQARR